MKTALEPPRSEEPELGDVLGFMRLLWAVDHGLNSVSKRMEDRLGVTGPQRLVVRLIGRFPGISAGELAGLLALHPSTLTGVLARLTRRGYITRKADPEDARRALFNLTNKGKQIDAHRTGTVEAAVRRGLAKLRAPQIAAAHTVLTAIAEALLEQGKL